jgi:hypothetical protein
LLVRNTQHDRRVVWLLAEVRLRITDAAYGPRYPAIGSSSDPGGFEQLLPTTTITTTTSRFVHRSHVVDTDGDSNRSAEARDGKGTAPLT